MADEKEFVLTREGKLELENELDTLKNVTRKEVSEKIKEARSFGDLSENAEYDEAKNEQEIQNALKEAMKDRTTLVIAHRMTTIEDADRIYVMQNGCVEGCGTHEELLQKDQIYQNLVRAQSYE